MRCKKCEADNREGARFCDKCGAKLSPLCPSCGAENRPDARFCDSCGSALTATVAASSVKERNESSIRITENAGVEGVDGERKTVTALFADIKGSMELMEGLDPEDARTIVDPALKLMIDAVHRYDGYIVQSTGDGIFALFGAPEAHEDHPQRALYTALRMQDEIRRYSAKLRGSGNLPIEARVGVNTGEVVVRSITTGEGHPEYTPIGHSISLAARMQSLSPTGSIATTDSTHKLCEGYFAFKLLGPTVVKGVSGPVEVYEVTGLGPLRTRLQRAVGLGLTKFVGREREIDSLRHVLEQAKAGHGQIVAAIAEPGVGKSRLLYEFKAISVSGCLVLEAYSVSHGKASAYLPVIDLLHGYFKITSDDDTRTRREKINGKALTLDRSLEETLPYLFVLLGIAEADDPIVQMDGQVRKRRTLEAIKRILMRESLNQPLIVIFEDLHWIDEQTQELLNLLADTIATAKILLLVSYRPEYSHHWNSKTCYTQLRLDPLDMESAEQMLSALLGDRKDLLPLKRLIIERTEGTPFFMEEIVQALFEDGVLQHNGSVKLTKSMKAAKVPATVQAVLASRIDRLPSDAKDLLQALAVIGREFPLSLIRAVVPKSDDELNHLLNDLQLGEFIYEQPALGDTEYIFKHALTQEVSYNSVLLERRKQLHERIGAALEKLNPNSIDDHLDDLAHHYSRSGNVTKALEYHERAGQQAVQRWAHGEAMRSFTSALELLQGMPPSSGRDQRELALQISLGPILMATKGFAAPETERVYLRAQELAQSGGTPTQRFSLLAGFFGVAFVGGRVRDAQERYESLREFIAKHPEPAFVLETYHHGWSVAFSAGELDRAQHHVQDGLAFYEAQLRGVPIPLYSAHHPAVCGHAFGAIVFWLRGYPDAARRHANQAVSLAREIGDPATSTFALASQAQVHQLAKRVEAALEMAEAAISLGSREGVFSVFESWAGIVKGWALAQLGHAEQGVALILEGLQLTAAGGAALLRTYNLAQLAEARGKAGLIGEGLETIVEALNLAEQNGERWWEAEIHRLHGELLSNQNSADQGQTQACFERAIEIARQQGAKSLELRATTSLAGLLRDTNRSDDARAVLAEIYNWFTEGLDTADLKDAKALLDELTS